MERINDEYSVVEKHAQTMLQLVEFGMDWYYGELEQIVHALFQLSLSCS